MTLTDVRVRTAKPAARPYKLTDGQGLYLLVMPSSTRLWRFKFRHVGKEKLLALGAYPDVSLSAARKARDHARDLLAKGDDPSLKKRREKARKAAAAEDTFAAVANELLAKSEREGMATITVGKKRWLLSLLSDLGSMAVANIEPADILAPLRKIERQGNLETARRALQFTGQVLRYAVATARLRSDPSRDLKGALTTPKVRHHAAILDPERVGELLRAIDGYNGHPSTKLALQIAPHVFVRPGELRHADWSEFNLDEARWAIPARRMKMRREHVVPLSTQVVVLLKQVPEPKRAGLVFKASGGKPLSENTINLALRRMKFGQDEMTSHGFRATASTLLNESGKWHPDAIERALAHGDDGSVRASYHRGAHWQERVLMAQWWSDYLDTLKAAKPLQEAA